MGPLDWLLLAVIAPAHFSLSGPSAGAIPAAAVAIAPAAAVPIAVRIQRLGKTAVALPQKGIIRLSRNLYQFFRKTIDSYAA